MTRWATTIAAWNVCRPTTLRASICCYGGATPTLIKEGTINGLYAAWVENTTDRPEPDGNGRISDEKQQYLFLYDPDKLCVVVLGENGKSARQWPRNSRSFRPTFPHRNATGTSSGSARWDKRCGGRSSLFPLDNFRLMR